MRDWNDKLANSAHIPGSEHLPGVWTSQAAACRRKVRAEEDIPDEPLPRHEPDLNRPDGPGKGIA